MKSILIILSALFMISCASSQKKLQRRVEKHGVPESIAFMAAKYPPYFKKKDTVVKDTILIHDTIVTKADTVTTFLSDSSGFLTLNNDSINLTVDKATNEVKIVYKEKKIPYAKIVYRDVACPEIDCPDCDNLVLDKKGPSYIWYVLVFLLGFYTPKLFKLLIKLIKP